MKQEFTLTLDNVKYTVSAEGDTIVVNGRSFTVKVAGDGRVLVDGIAYPVTLSGETATVDGHTHSVQTEGLAPLAAPVPSSGVAAPARTAASSVGSGAVTAIMPGKIVRLLVVQGQQVQEGDPVCVLEAMKMENELRARQAGTVQAVHVEPGADVEKGQVLVEIG